MSREIDEYNKAYIPNKEELSTDYQIYYPLLVLRGPMFEYHMPPSVSDISLASDAFS